MAKIKPFHIFIIILVIIGGYMYLNKGTTQSVYTCDDNVWSNWDTKHCAIDECIDSNIIRRYLPNGYIEVGCSSYLSGSHCENGVCVITPLNQQEGYQEKATKVEVITNGWVGSQYVDDGIYTDESSAYPQPNAGTQTMIFHWTKPTGTYQVDIDQMAIGAGHPLATIGDDWTTFKPCWNQGNEIIVKLDWDSSAIHFSCYGGSSNGYISIMDTSYSSESDKLQDINAKWYIGSAQQTPCPTSGSCSDCIIYYVTYDNFIHGGSCTQAIMDNCINSLAQKNIVASGTTCGSNKPSCNTDADTDCNNHVDRSELGVFITKWVNGQTTRDILGQVIQAWTNG